MDAKISFGFKKLPKKSAVLGAKPPDPKKVELIKCVDSQGFKLIDHVEEEDRPPLIIPLLDQNKTLEDRIQDAIDLKERSRIKYEDKNKEQIDNRPDSELTVEELAARQLIQEAENYVGKKTSATLVRSIPVDHLLLEGAVEPTQDDYDAVPISEYGYAMLRGMGWKEEDVSTTKVDIPDVRPKGMGLGASVCGGKAIRIPKDKQGNDLRLVKGAKAKVIAGKDKGNYGIVQGLDDDAGRIIIRMTLSGVIVSLNEFMLLPVTHEEYAQCANVLNHAKFEKYKAKDTNTRHKQTQELNDSNNDVVYVPNDIKPEIISSGSDVPAGKVRTSSKRKVKREHRSRTHHIQRSRTRSNSGSNLDENKRHRRKSKSEKSGKEKKKHKKKKSRSRYKSKSHSDDVS